MALEALSPTSRRHPARSPCPARPVCWPRKPLTGAGVLWLALFQLILGGCSLSSGITHNSIDYNTALEDVTNNMLVTNILLARDQAPLHFTDLSQIRGSLQLQAQAQVSAPFGQQYRSGNRVRDIGQLMIGGTSNPTFDVVPLNTKAFTEGITTPIELRFFQYYVNRGMNPGLVLSLFVEKLDVISDYAGNQLECEFINYPSTEYKSTNPDSETCSVQAEKILAVQRIVKSNVLNFRDILPTLSDNLEFTSYNKLTRYGPPFAVSEADLLRSAASLAANGLELRRVDRTNRFQLFKRTKETAICLEPDGKRPWYQLQLGSLGAAVNRAIPEDSALDICVYSGENPNGRSGNMSGSDHRTKPQVILYLRSVESVFTYLGQMLNVPRPNRMLPFDIKDTQGSTTRFSVPYLGNTYYVENTRVSCDYASSLDYALMRTPCSAVSNEEDLTLLILGILNQTLNLYKNANEIPTTRAVQSVP